MGKFNEVKVALEQVCNNLQYNGENPFVDVLRYGTNDFSGYPSVTIINGEILSEYHTTTQNKRTYVAYVYIYANLEKVDQLTAWDMLTDLQELVIDSVDRTENFNGTADMVNPASAEPYETNPGEGGRLLVAPVRVEAVYSFYFK